jgi:hypothetical protein
MILKYHIKRKINCYYFFYLLVIRVNLLLFAIHESYVVAISGHDIIDIYLSWG